MTLPPELTTLLVSAMPISELRGAIPLAIGVFKLPPAWALFWAVLGNLLPVPFILMALGPMSTWLMRISPIARRFFTWLFARTRRKHSRAFEIYRDLALMIFVAIPLPLTGAWSGAVAAHVFGIQPRTAFACIAAGVLIASIVVTLATLGIIRLM